MIEKERIVRMLERAKVEAEDGNFFGVWIIAELVQVGLSNDLPLGPEFGSDRYIDDFISVEVERRREMQKQKNPPARAEWSSRRADH